MRGILPQIEEEGKTWKGNSAPQAGGKRGRRRGGSATNWGETKRGRRGKGGRGDTETSTSYLGGKRGQGSGIVWSTHHFLTLSRAEQRNHNTSQLLDEAWRVELDPWNNF